MPATLAQKSDLPPISEDHAFRENDRVEMPLYGKKTIRGLVKNIDITVGKKRFVGLVVLGDDTRYYEFHPEIARKIEEAR